MRDFKYPHPGEILKEEFLDPMGITAYRLSQAIDVPQSRIGEIIAGNRSVSADTALRLARFFGTSDVFWIHLQTDFDLSKAHDEHDEELEQIEPYVAMRA